MGDLTFSTLLNNIAECNYFDITNAKILSSTANGITFLHLNLRSINDQENFDKFYKFQTFLPSLSGIVCVLETRLKSDPLINISVPNYSFEHADSMTNAGGVGSYVSSKLRFEVDPTLEIKINGCENLWLNILNDKARYKFTLTAIYRHPDYIAVENFSEALSNSLNLTQRKGMYYLLRDISINISPDRRRSVTETYFDCLTSSGAVPILYLLL